MARLAAQRDIAIDSVHCRAICEEIGYRLRQTLKVGTAEHPAHLRLLERLRRQDSVGTPSAALPFDPMKSRSGKSRTSTRKRTG
jgi:hypothetical protein